MPRQKKKPETILTVDGKPIDTDTKRELTKAIDKILPYMRQAEIAHSSGCKQRAEMFERRIEDELALFVGRQREFLRDRLESERTLFRNASKISA